MKEKACGPTDVFIFLPGTINSRRNSGGRVFSMQSLILEFGNLIILEMYAKFM